MFTTPLFNIYFTLPNSHATIAHAVSPRHMAQLLRSRHFFFFAPALVFPDYFFVTYNPTRLLLSVADTSPSCRSTIVIAGLLCWITPIPRRHASAHISSVMPKHHDASSPFIAQIASEMPPPINAMPGEGPATYRRADRLSAFYARSYAFITPVRDAAHRCFLRHALLPATSPRHNATIIHQMSAAKRMPAILLPEADKRRVARHTWRATEIFAIRQNVLEMLRWRATGRVFRFMSDDSAKISFSFCFYDILFAMPRRRARRASARRHDTMRET